MLVHTRRVITSKMKFWSLIWRERERESVCVCARVHACVCAWVCELIALLNYESVKCAFLCVFTTVLLLWGVVLVVFWSGGRVKIWRLVLVMWYIYTFNHVFHFSDEIIIKVNLNVELQGFTRQWAALTSPSCNPQLQGASLGSEQCSRPQDAILNCKASLSKWAALTSPSCNPKLQGFTKQVSSTHVPKLQSWTAGLH